MKTILDIVVSALLFAAGCDSSLGLKPRISAAMTGVGRELRITDYSAFGGWGTGENGHGIYVVVWAEKDACDYQPNLKLELEDAAKVSAALAGCDTVMKYDYLNLHYTNRYGHINGSLWIVAGGAQVVMKRETLRELRDANTPASEYPQRWKFLHGFKDRPDSKESLLWPENSY